MGRIRSFLLAMTCFIGVNIYAQPAHTWLDKGSILTYKVIIYEDTFLLKATIAEIGDNFMFSYFSELDSLKGRINLSAEAMDDSKTQIYNFLGGYQSYVNNTVLTLSRKSYADLLEGKNIEMFTGESMPQEITLTYKPDSVFAQANHTIPGTTYSINGQIADPHDHKLVVDVASENNLFYTVLADQRYPLVTYMRRDWSYELIEVTIP